MQPDRKALLGALDSKSSKPVSIAYEAASALKRCDGRACEVSHQAPPGCSLLGSFRNILIR